MDSDESVLEQDYVQFPLARDEVRRRLRAARALAGFTVAELAQHELVAANGLTVSTIGETEREDRDAKPMELEILARACGLRPDWFTVPLGHLGDSEVVWVALARRLARIEQALDIANDDDDAPEAFEREIERAVEAPSRAASGSRQTRRPSARRRATR